jgi:hypothetical protein
MFTTQEREYSYKSYPNTPTFELNINSDIQKYYHCDYIGSSTEKKCNDNQFAILCRAESILLATRYKNTSKLNHSGRGAFSSRGLNLNIPPAHVCVWPTFGDVKIYLLSLFCIEFVNGRRA